MDGVRQTRVSDPRPLGRSRRSAATLVLAVLLAGPMWTATATAENAWVRGGIRLNLRTEPGTKFRILGVITTGEGVEVLERIEDWTRIRLPDGKEGWIPDGYLQSEPTPALRIEH